MSKSSCKVPECTEEAKEGRDFCTKHSCMVFGCTEATKEDRDFCTRHWRMITPTLKKVLATGDVDVVLEFLTYKDTLIHQGYEFEVRFTKKQAKLGRSHLGVARKVYNWGLEVLEAWWWEVREPVLSAARRKKEEEAAKKGAATKSKKEEATKKGAAAKSKKGAAKAKKKECKKPDTSRGLAHLQAWWTTPHKKTGELPKEGARPKEGDLYTMFATQVMTKPEMAWARECIAGCRSYAIKDLSSAYKNFFAGVEQRKGGGRSDTGRPKRKKFRDSNTFTVQPCSDSKAKPNATSEWMQTCVKDHSIFIQKFGWIETKESTTKMKGRILRVVFEYKCGRWWIKCMVERQAKDQRPKEFPNKVIGLDMGVNSVLTLSRPYTGKSVPDFLGEDHQTVIPPRPLGLALKRKRRMSRTWSRCAGSLYRRMLFGLVEESKTLKAWKGFMHPGPFGALMRLVHQLGHVEIEALCDIEVQVGRKQLKANKILVVAGQKLNTGTLMFIPKTNNRYLYDKLNVSLTNRGRVSLLRGPAPVPYTVDGKEKVWVPSSNGWEQQKLALAKLDHHIHNIRRDHLNKVSTWLVNTYGTIVCEGFNIKELVKKRDGKGVVRRRKRRREISDLGWGGLRVRLTYKMGPKWYGGTYVQLPDDEPTDRTCHRCGTLNAKLPPDTNIFICVKCDLTTTRQRNTALYCESFGRKSGSTGCGQPGTDAPGDSVSRGLFAHESKDRFGGKNGEPSHQEGTFRDNWVPEGPSLSVAQERGSAASKVSDKKNKRLRKRKDGETDVTESGT